MQGPPSSHGAQRIAQGCQARRACGKDCIPGRDMMSALTAPRCKSCPVPSPPPPPPPCLVWLLKCNAPCLQSGDGSPLVAVKMALSAASSKPAVSGLMACHYQHCCC